MLSQTPDGAVEVGEPEQAEEGDDQHLAQDGNAVGKIGDAAAEQRGFGEIECGHGNIMPQLDHCASDGDGFLN